jgi:predicted anti-sigma-YlaC factor YlaD
MDGTTTSCDTYGARLAADPAAAARDPRVVLHLARCEDCRRFRRQVIEQRAEIRAALSRLPSEELRPEQRSRARELPRGRPVVEPRGL